MFRIAECREEVHGTGGHLLIRGDGGAAHPLLQPLRGKVQLVYVDPPFMTGERFHIRRPLGEAGWRTGRPTVSHLGYTDPAQDAAAYEVTLRRLVEQGHGLLADTGVMALHLDWRANWLGRMVLEQVFGTERFMNEIIWGYESGGRSIKHFSRKHDTILLFSKTAHPRYDIRRVPIGTLQDRKNHMALCRDEAGKPYRTIVSGGKEYRYPLDAPCYPGDVWTDIPHLQQRDPERTGYPTQKPLRLLERLMKPAVNPGDWVADLCCGSGGAGVMAEQLGARALLMDISGQALSTAAHRLMNPFALYGETTVDDAGLRGELETESGLFFQSCRVRLCGFQGVGAPGGMEQGMENIESWSPGRLHHQRFHGHGAFRRTRKIPRLPMDGLILPGDGLPSVLLVDVWGRRRVYCWASNE